MPDQKDKRNITRALIRQYEHPTELTADMLNALIEKIIIHEKAVGEGGEKEQEMGWLIWFIGKICCHYFRGKYLMCYSVYDLCLPFSVCLCILLLKCLFRSHYHIRKEG